MKTSTKLTCPVCQTSVLEDSTFREGICLDCHTERARAGLSAVVYEPQRQSKYRSKFLYVIQGYDNTGNGWQDSCLGGHTPQAAIAYAEKHRGEFAMPGTRLRVVPCRSL